jgi:hypothetical protein
MTKKKRRMRMRKIAMSKEGNLHWINSKHFWFKSWKTPRCLNFWLSSIKVCLTRFNKPHQSSEV